MVRVLIVDDNPLVRKSYRALLQREADIEIAGEARDGQEAIDCSQSLSPDIVLMDIRMPRMDGLAATAKMKTMGIASRVIVVSLYAEETWVRAAFDRGACGFVLKQNTFDEMADAIRIVAAGGQFLSPQLRPPDEAPVYPAALATRVDNSDHGQGTVGGK